jgi:Flp pilus assembly protein TadG
MSISTPCLPADRRAGVALLTALALVPMVLAAGVAVDLSRVTSFRTALQAAADQAALAGAAADNSSGQATAAVAVANAYMTQAEAGLPANNGVTVTVVSGTSPGAGGTTAGYTISVTASASVPTTLMSLVTPAVSTSVTASALNPAVTLNPGGVSVGNTTQDSNTVYWYVVHQDGSLPAAGDLHQMAAAGSGGTVSSAITATAGDRIGFALCDHHNPTGESDQQTTTWTYSQDQSDGSDMGQSCALRTVVRGDDQGDDAPDAPSSCPTATQAQAVLNCQQVPGQTVYYYWNDSNSHRWDDQEGDNSHWDDGEGEQSFNAARYNVTCPAPPSASASASGAAASAAAVVLTN